jgi:hypothetical protein
MKKPGRYQFSGVGSHRASTGRPGRASTYPSRQRRCAAELSQLANAAARLLLRSQASCKAYCSQSGEMKGEAPPLHFTRHMNVDRPLNR